MAATIDRINQLSTERSRLYREASNGRRGDPDVIARLRVLDAELQRLWDVRRQERAGRREGIDLLVDRAYADRYGRNYEEAVSPSTVGEAGDARLARAA
ncbi:MAG: DUF2630 family protein [Dehalococcoidia bacterium]|nr:DUF2630 family protein [Dehalococcoidia bacterium]